MSQVTLVIPDDVVSALRLPPDEIESTLRKELVLALYQRRVLPMAKAAVLAQMSRWDFEELLCQRHIERPFSEEDLAADLKFAQEFSKGERFP
jgi:predicted HTH domain antitoxin